MNHYQHKALAAGCFVLFLIVLFPPWYYTEAIYAGRNFAGYGPLWSGPDTYASVTVAVDRILLQVLGACLLTVLGVIVASRLPEA